MFKTYMGVTEDAKNEVYLRPETAQGIFVNFANIQRTTRKNSPSAFARSVKVSETKSLPVTSFSVSASLNRWNANFSANPTPTLNGLTIGEATAKLPHFSRHEGRKHAAARP